jgi:clan AA aspartic protease (TIGR02281 family)
MLPEKKQTMTSRSARRVRRSLRLVAIAAVFSVPACIHNAAALRSGRKINYWEALSDLRADDAVSAARTPSEKEFARALENLMDGDIDRAETDFGQLRQTATDSIIRAGSRVIYTATLQYQEKWKQLMELRSEPGRRADALDKASIESWAAAFRDAPPKTLTFHAQSVLIPISVSAVGTPLVPVRIGKRDYNFWLDTGSSMTMLASDVASDLGIRTNGVDTLEIVTATGRVKALPAVIPQLELGQLVIRNAPTMIVDESLMQMRELKQMELGPQLKIDGIIGFDVIRQLDLEVDYADNTVHLRDPSTSRRTAKRNMFWVGLPVIRMSAPDGTPLHFGLDTGAQLTFVTETLLDKLQLQPGRIESRRVGGLGGEISLRAPIMPDLRLFVRGFPIIFKGAVVRAPVYQVLASLDGVLGGDVWNSGVVRIDMTNGVFGVRRSGSTTEGAYR